MCEIGTEWAGGRPCQKVFRGSAEKGMRIVAMRFARLQAAR